MEAAPARQDGQERGARLLQDEADRRVVHDLDRLDVAEEVGGEGILAELVGRMLRVDLPLDGELHRLRVERGAVVEGDALAQLEGVGEPVLRDRPGLGEPGHDLGGLVREGDQGLHDPPAHAVGVEVGDLGRVERHRLRHQPDHQRARRLRGRARRPGGQHHEKRQGRTRPEPSPSHRACPPAAPEPPADGGRSAPSISPRAAALTSLAPAPRVMPRSKGGLMAKLKFGAWIPTYAWSGKKTDPKNMAADPRVHREVREARHRRVGHRPPPVRARPLRQRLARAAQLARLRGRADQEGGHRHRHPRAAGAPSGGAGQGDLDALPPLGEPLHVRRRPRAGTRASTR